MYSIVFLSHTPRSSIFRVGSHHLSKALASAGHRVAHIATPFSLAHRILRPGQHARRRDAAAGAHRVDGVVDLVPRSVLPADLLWSAHQTRAALSAVGIERPDFVFIDQPLFRPEHFPQSVVTFRPTDLFPRGHLTRRAQIVASLSDVVVATSPGVLAAYGSSSSAPRHVLENGVEFERFHDAVGEPKEYDFVYVGAIDDRFSFESLIAAATALPTASFAIYGPAPSNHPPLPPNVVMCGPVKYESAPSAMARGRWGIMPLVDSASNGSRSPMKLYEYISAGLPVIAPHAITKRVPQLRSVVGYDPAVPAAFAQALVECATSGEHAVDEADIAFAESKDWSRIATLLLRLAEPSTVAPQSGA